MGGGAHQLREVDGFLEVLECSKVDQRRGDDAFWALGGLQHLSAS